MLKKIILAVLIALPSFAFGQKLAVIDTESILTSMPEIKDMNATIEAASKKYEEELKNLQDKFQKEYTDFQNLPADTPESIKQRRTQELNELDQKMNQFYTTAQQDIQQQQQRLLAPIRERVQAAIQTVGAEGGYTMIFEKQMPLYVGADAVDITSAVRTKLGI